MAGEDTMGAKKTRATKQTKTSADSKLEKHKFPYWAKVQNTGADPCFPLMDGQRVVVMGEISNMPAHALVVDESGIVYVAVHLTSLRPLSKHEV